MAVTTTSTLPSPSKSAKAAPRKCAVCRNDAPACSQVAKILEEDPLGAKGAPFFQANLNKTIPEPLAGLVHFKTLQKDQPVSGSYELTTRDGKKKFKGSFQAAWGNKPLRVIR